MTTAWLTRFVEESNRIEGIPTVKQSDLDAHAAFLSLDEITVEALESFVSTVQPGARLRDKFGMDVRVGDHIPPRGDPGMRMSLERILFEVNRGAPPYVAHHLYETLHPFMDGNGRSGRAIWLWMMQDQDDFGPAVARGFLHSWYYQSLSENRV